MNDYDEKYEPSDDYEGAAHQLSMVRQQQALDSLYALWFDSNGLSVEDADRHATNVAAELGLLNEWNQLRGPSK